MTTSTLIWLCITFTIGLLIGSCLSFRKNHSPKLTQTESKAEPLADSEPAIAYTTETHDSASPREQLFKLKKTLEDKDDEILQPEDLNRLPEFEQGVKLLTGSAFTVDDCLTFAASEGYVLSCMAMCAIANRPEDTAIEVAKRASQLGEYATHFLIKYLETVKDINTASCFLTHCNSWWWWREEVNLVKELQIYLSHVVSAQPEISPDAAVLADIDCERLSDTLYLLEQLNLSGLDNLVQAIKSTLDSKRAPSVLSTIGRLLTNKEDADYVPQAGYEILVAKVIGNLQSEAARSQIFCAEDGCGKTTLIKRIARELTTQGWMVFEASGSQVLAGQSYIGELEERLKIMLEIFRHPKRLWIVPDFSELVYKGAYTQDPRGILDMIMPAMEKGELLILGETSPKLFAHLLSVRPALRHVLETVNLPALTAEESAVMANDWLKARQVEQSQHTVADDGLVHEAMQLTAQYLPEQQLPGRIISLLKTSYHHALTQIPPTLPLNRASLVATLSSISGLPVSILDENARLSLENLREGFNQRVIGQDEAVECLIDRISMLKAGLIDPKRPIGVFLFAGPTGTGKTEIAKTLAECLFGSEERMIRLDMSEYQSEGAYWRLIAADKDGQSRSLVTRIREQPFSVILLDEFEKADPKVWDLFLQVFDDGRLTDERGIVADLRHTLIILTSNLGATISRDSGPGFVAAGGEFSRSVVEKALHMTFRREFINRLDRVVIFNPLTRKVMRDILQKELRQVLTRRGLRNRDWAVEWEPSAIEFLLDKGFTPDLGARPLRRAVEHYLLAPLSRTIVEHKVPDGDQFLFIRSVNNKLDVEFIDPDLEIKKTEGEETTNKTILSLRSLMLTPQLTDAALSCMSQAAGNIIQTLKSESWVNARQQAYQTMAQQDFWSSEYRFTVLDQLERTDRIECAMDAAIRLRERLTQQGANLQMVQGLAQLLFLIGLAIEDFVNGTPQDAVIYLYANLDEVTSDLHRPLREWWQKLMRMYLNWAERRHMQVQIVEQDASRCHAQIAVSGFAAWSLLSEEGGLHILEEDTEPPTRLRVRVYVGSDSQQILQPAFDTRICRRYREKPSPLVRDSIKGWRTGRLNRVFAGEFDIMEGTDK